MDVYLQDIVIEGMEFANEEAAKEYIKVLAEKIDSEAKDGGNYIENQETIASLVYDFLTPNVVKRLTRKEKENIEYNKLNIVNEVLFDCIETLPKGSKNIIHKKSNVNAIF